MMSAKPDCGVLCPKCRSKNVEVYDVDARPVVWECLSCHFLFRLDDCMKAYSDEVLAEMR